MSDLSCSSLKCILGSNEDVVFREITANDIHFSILFVEGLIDYELIDNFILKPLVHDDKFKAAKTEHELLDLIRQGGLYHAAQNERADMDDVVKDVLSNHIAIIFDNEQIAFTFNVKGFQTRTITEPTSENVIKGAKDSFVETLRVNTALVRRRIKSPELTIESMVIGQQTQTQVDMVYLKNIANPDMLAELKKRLSAIKVDGVLASGFLEEFILDHRYFIFPQYIETERPDRFCSDLLEGRLGIIIDGIPLGIIVPGSLLQCIQAPDDYSQNTILASGKKFLRFILLFITLFSPALYTAVTTHHPEMIATKLATFISAAKEGVPFPSFVEVLIMLIAFEVLTEAGLRLPKMIGQATSIVGALVVGEVAVSASLVSPTVVVVIAMTAISGYSIPNQDFSNALRIWRLALVIAAATLGIFAIVIVTLLMLMFLCRVEVLGFPYLAPFVTTDYLDLKDTLFRFSIPSMKFRPYNLKTKNRKRVG